MLKILARAAQDLGCELYNSNYVDLANTNLNLTKQWLINNGFSESKVRVGRWYKGKIQLMLDGGFLSLPSV